MDLRHFAVDLTGRRCHRSHLGPPILRLRRAGAASCVQLPQPTIVELFQRADSAVRRTPAPTTTATVPGWGEALVVLPEWGPHDGREFFDDFVEGDVAVRGVRLFQFGGVECFDFLLQMSVEEVGEGAALFEELGESAGFGDAAVVEDDELVEMGEELVAVDDDNPGLKIIGLQVSVDWLLDLVDCPLSFVVIRWFYRTQWSFFLIFSTSEGCAQYLVL